MTTTQTTEARVAKFNGYSCNRCAEWFYSSQMFRSATCPICDGRITFRGAVRQNRSVTFDAEIPPCDGQCTSARGTKCECKCGGRNHGSGRTITVTVAAGKAQVSLDDPELAQRLRDSRRPQIEAAEVYEEHVMARLSEVYGTVFQQYRDGVWMDEADFRKYLQGSSLRREVALSRRLKTPAGRVRRLQAVEDALTW